MSRRDEMRESLTGALTGLRAELQSALATASAPGPATTSASRTTSPSSPTNRGVELTRQLSGMLARRLGPVEPDAPRTVRGALAEINERRASADGIPYAGVAAGSVPLAAANGGPSPAPPPVPVFSGCAVPQGMEEDATAPAARNGTPPLISPGLRRAAANDPLLGPEGQELPPPYARQAPVAIEDATAGLNLPSERWHTYSTKNKKLALSIRAPGERHVLVLQLANGRDGATIVSGEVALELPNPESISHVKVRMKGISRTTVLRVHGSGRHPVTDEIQFFEDSETLYDESAELPASNLCIEPGKLSGSFKFPFELSIPGGIPRQGTGITRHIPMPPSFALANGDHMTAGSDWASCRYFFKVTVGRKGFLKQNERLIVPFVFMPFSSGREDQTRMLLMSGRSFPGPLEDPGGWDGKCSRKQVSRGVFSKQKAWFEVVLLVPKPKVFSKASGVPFAVKIVSSDPNVTTIFPTGTITIFLLQRTQISAQGLAAHHDHYATKGLVWESGEESGEQLDPEVADGAVWGRKLRGIIKVEGTPSFLAPNLGVSFHVMVRVVCPGQGNDLEMTVPISIVNMFPTTSNELDTEDEFEYNLPPSYFDEADMAKS